MRGVRVFLLPVVLVVCSAVISLFIHARSITQRAEALVQTTFELSTRRDAIPLDVLQRRFGADLRPTNGCTDHQCSYEVSVSNKVLAYLKLVPYANLVSSFWVEDGIVEGNMLDFTTATYGGHSVVVHAQTNFEDIDEFYLHPWEKSSPSDTNGLVAITSGVPIEKKIALALDVHCLSKPGGCSTVAEILPTIWQRASNGDIDSRISNHEGYIDRPPSF